MSNQKSRRSFAMSAAQVFLLDNAQTSVNLLRNKVALNKLFLSAARDGRNLRGRFLAQVMSVTLPS
jgi:hypothetical protein